MMMYYIPAIAFILTLKLKLLCIEIDVTIVNMVVNRYHENISSWNPKVDTGQKKNNSLLFNAVKGRKFAKGGEVEKSGQKMFDWLKSGHTH